MYTQLIKRTKQYLKFYEQNIQEVSLKQYRDQLTQNGQNIIHHNQKILKKKDNKFLMQSKSLLLTKKQLMKIIQILHEQNKKLERFAQKKQQDQDKQNRIRFQKQCSLSKLDLLSSVANLPQNNRRKIIKNKDNNNVINKSKTHKQLQSKIQTLKYKLHLYQNELQRQMVKKGELNAKIEAYEEYLNEIGMPVDKTVMQTDQKECIYQMGEIKDDNKKNIQYEKCNKKSDLNKRNSNNNQKFDDSELHIKKVSEWMMKNQRNEMIISQRIHDNKMKHKQFRDKNVQMRSNGGERGNNLKEQQANYQQQKIIHTEKWDQPHKQGPNEQNQKLDHHNQYDFQDSQTIQHSLKLPNSNLLQSKNNYQLKIQEQQNQKQLSSHLLLNTFTFQPLQLSLQHHAFHQQGQVAIVQLIKGFQFININEDSLFQSFANKNISKKIHLNIKQNQNKAIKNNNSSKKNTSQKFQNKKSNTKNSFNLQQNNNSKNNSISFLNQLINPNNFRNHQNQFEQHQQQSSSLVQVSSFMRNYIDVGNNNRSESVRKNQFKFIQNENESKMYTKKIDKDQEQKKINQNKSISIYKDQIKSIDLGITKDAYIRKDQVIAQKQQLIKTKMKVFSKYNQSQQQNFYEEQKKIEQNLLPQQQEYQSNKESQNSNSIQNQDDNSQKQQQNKLDLMRRLMMISNISKNINKELVKNDSNQLSNWQYYDSKWYNNLTQKEQSRKIKEDNQLIDKDENMSNSKNKIQQTPDQIQNPQFQLSSSSSQSWNEG